MTGITAIRAALTTLANAERGHAILMDAAQTTLNDLRRRVDDIKAQHDLAAQQERETMSRRLGGSFQREGEP